MTQVVQNSTKTLAKIAQKLETQQLIMIHIMWPLIFLHFEYICQIYWKLAFWPKRSRAVTKVWPKMMPKFHIQQFYHEILHVTTHISSSWINILDFIKKLHFVPSGLNYYQKISQKWCKNYPKITHWTILPWSTSCDPSNFFTWN